MAEFNSGLFSPNPVSSIARSNAGNVNSGLGFAAQAINKATTKTDGNVFDTFTLPMRQRKRRLAAQEATQKGLKANSPEFYSYMTEKLTEFGDLEGAEISTAKGLEIQKGQAAIAETESTTGLREAQTKDLPKAAEDRRRRLDQVDAEIDLKERTLDITETPEERASREAAADKAAEARTRITAEASTNAALIRERAAMNAARAAARGTGAGEISAGDVTLGANTLLDAALQSGDKNNNTMQLWGEALGVDMNEVKDDLLSSNAGKRKAAEAIMASAGQRVALRAEELKDEFPQMSQRDRYRIALESGGGKVRYVTTPEDGKKYIVTAGNEVYAID